MTPALLAETTLRQISRQYQTEAADPAGGWLMLLVPPFAIAIGLAIYAVSKRRPKPIDTPDGLVGQLCRVHGLPAAARELLLKIGRAAELSQPATMFLSRQQFDAAVATASKRFDLLETDQHYVSLTRRTVFPPPPNP